MSDDKIIDPFAIASTDPFGSLGGDPFGSTPMDVFSPHSSAFDTSNNDYWESVSEPLEDESPEETSARVLNAVQQAFKDRATAEMKRMNDAVDSEYWLCFIFQTRGQKEQFLERAGIAVALHGDKYLDGPTIAAHLGFPVDPVEVRYNTSAKLDSKLGSLARTPLEVRSSENWHEGE